MAKFLPTKKLLTDFNGGNRYVSGDGVQPTTLNNIIESQLYTQEMVENVPNGYSIRLTKLQLDNYAISGSATTTSLSNIANPLGIKIGDIVLDNFKTEYAFFMSYWQVTEVSGGIVYLQAIDYYPTVDIAQTTGTSKFAVMSQKSVTDTFNKSIAYTDSVKTGITKNSKRIFNIESFIFKENYYTDNTTAYIKQVPENSLPYVAISKIGGMTKKCTNIFPPTVEYGWQCDIPTLSEDGKYTFTRNASNGVCYFQTKPIYLEAGKTYTLRANYTGVSHTYLVKQSGESIVATLYGLTKFTPTESGNYFFRPYMTGTNIGDTASVYLWINEGDVDLSYEPYFEGLRNAKVSAVKSVGKNLVNQSKLLEKSGVTLNADGYYYAETTTILSNALTQVISGIVYKANTQYSISVTGYGSSNSQGLVIQVDYTDGSTTYPIGIANTVASTFTHTTKLGKTVKRITATLYNGTIINYIKNIVIREGTDTAYSPYTEHTLVIPEAVQSLDGYGQSNPDNAEEYNYIDFDNFISCGHIVDGVWIAYETKQKTDISNLITSDNLIGVEGGGIITFENEYKYNVPSEIVYQIGGEQQ